MAIDYFSNQNCEDRLGSVYGQALCKHLFHKDYFCNTLWVSQEGYVRLPMQMVSGSKHAGIKNSEYAKDNIMGIIIKRAFYQEYSSSSPNNSPHAQRMTSRITRSRRSG